MTTARMGLALALVLACESSAPDASGALPATTPVAPTRAPAPVPAGWSLLDELRIFERAGLPRADVLASVTRTTAAFLPGETPWGRIAPGHRVDLLVLATDPLARLAALHVIDGVMTNGRWHRARPAC